jgi:DNA-binding XRE family transcriptional regulator
MLTIKPKTQKLQTVRIKNGLSTKKLAVKAKLNPLTILNIENGLSAPNPSTASKICTALGVGFDDIFELVDEKKAGV